MATPGMGLPPGGGSTAGVPAKKKRGRPKGSTSSGDGSSRGGAKSSRRSAPADEEESSDIWLCCDVCKKWRRLPQDSELPHEDGEWQCSLLPGLSCEVEEETCKDTWREEPEVVQAAALTARQQAEEEKLTLELSALDPTPAPAVALPHLPPGWSVVRQVTSSQG